jgi:hypothetical protein
MVETSLSGAPDPQDSSMDGGSVSAAGAAAVEVELPRWWLHEHLTRLVTERVRRLRGRDGPSALRPLVGDEVSLRGEAATLLWLKARGFRLSEDREAPWSDVMVGTPGPPWVSVGVESWPTPDSRRLGLHVPAWRLARSVGHAWLVVWTSVEGAVVTLNGWTTSAYVLDAGLACRPVERPARVPVQCLRGMDELAGELRVGVSRPAAPRAPTSPPR